VCSPFAVAAGATAAGSVAGAAAAYRGAQLNKAGFEFQEGVERRNADIADQQASDALVRGERAEGQVRMRTASLKGAQRARFAAAGLDLNEGSPLSILMDTDYMGELDALTVRDNASREAWALRETARTGRMNADFLHWRAGQESPGRAAATSLLGSAGSVASSWYAYGRRT